MSTCYEKQGTLYRGILSKTELGHDCLSLTFEFLSHMHNITDVEEAEKLGLGGHSFCRNPDNDIKPWCYIRQNNRTSWDYCKLSPCPMYGE
uniref:Kringle domain-containing protein n=1 Tax=Callorhinchus milii TaxID=7868 RepID=A0A4W3KA78_CALMI